MGGLRYRMLRGLNRLAASSDVVLDPALLTQATRATAEGVFRVLHWRVVLESGVRSSRRAPRRATGCWCSCSRTRRRRRSSGCCGCWRCSTAGEDFRDIYRGLRSRDARQRASSRELLENLLRPPLRARSWRSSARDRTRHGSRARATLYGVRAARLPGGARAHPRGRRRVAALHRGPPHRRARPRRAAPTLEALAATRTGFFLSRVLERTLGALSRHPGAGVCLKRRG